MSMKKTLVYLKDIPTENCMMDCDSIIELSKQGLYACDYCNCNCEKETEESDT